MPNGRITHGFLKPSTAISVFRIVSDRTRSGAVRSQFEADRTADVMHDQVETVQAERIEPQPPQTVPDPSSV